jgi:acyl-CoA dehydrogenase
LGFSTDMPLEQMYRSARAARIYDGPDEVHRQSVARRVLRGYKPPANGVPSEYVPARRADGLQRFADLIDLAAINR